MKQKEVVKYCAKDVDEQNDNHSQYIWFVHEKHHYEQFEWHFDYHNAK